MGIERFFKSIEQNNITNLNNEFSRKLEHKIDTKYLFIDFNSIVYITSNKILYDINRLIYSNINNKKSEKISSIAKIYNIDLGSPIKEQVDINKIIINGVKKYIINILQNYVNPNVLEYFYIAVDGVPDKAKILEQKQRRYMGGLISEIKQKIFNKHINEIKNDKIRYQYETNKINWSRNNISPGTNFMKILDDMLNGDELNSEIKKLCPKLKKYICSGVNIRGEGEKKITDNIKSIKDISDVVIYSPDTDVTLLGLILHVKNLIILRHDQQGGYYNIINIDKLGDNIFNYISSKVDSKLNKKNIIDDIVFVLTIFGNDFVPKLQSFDVKHDFDKIIDKYVNTLKENKFGYIIEKNKINQQNFLNLIKILHYDEGGNLQKVFIASHYENYNKLKKIMQADSTNFTIILNEFLSKLRKFNFDIRNGKNVTEHKNDQDFMKKIKLLTKMDNKTFNNDKQFIDAYINYYKKNNKFPKVKVSFVKYSKSINTEHHRIKLEKIHDSIDPGMKILEYDKEVYKFDNMLDEYSKKLNAFPINLGYIVVDPNNYVFKTENIEKSVKRYYYEFFDINTIDVDDNKMKKILENYLEGLLWVFEYYYNSSLDNTVNVWYYHHHFAPLLKQIYLFLKDQKKDYIQNLCNNLKTYKIDHKEYFTQIEHLLYTSPVHVIKDIVPKKYHEIINNKELFPELEKVTMEIFNNETNNKIDCRGALFITKCNLKILEDKVDFEFDKKFIKEIRKI
jgi:5'-3' exonuclease